VGDIWKLYVNMSALVSCVERVVFEIGCEADASVVFFVVFVFVSQIGRYELLDFAVSGVSDVIASSCTIG